MSNPNITTIKPEGSPLGFRIGIREALAVGLVTLTAAGCGGGSSGEDADRAKSSNTPEMTADPKPGNGMNESQAPVTDKTGSVTYEHVPSEVSDPVQESLDCAEDVAAGGGGTMGDYDKCADIADEALDGPYN